VSAGDASNQPGSAPPDARFDIVALYNNDRSSRPPLQEPFMSAIDGFVIAPKPAAHFGVGAIERLPAIVRAVGAEAVVLVTDEALASTPAVATVLAVLADAGLPARVFSGVHPNPTTDDLAAGAAAVAEAVAGAAAVVEAAAVTATLRPSAPLVSPSAPADPTASPALSTSLAPLATRIALVAVGGGAPIDAAKGIAIAAVNPERGQDLDYRRRFTVPGPPIVAVPTTAGTGAEVSALGVVTDPAARRTFYVGHPSSMPAAAILDPALTVGLPPALTAATGLEALTNALESYLSVRPNPWSDGIALQAIRMVATHLPRACADGTDLAARSQMLLAAHLAGVAMASTGPGLCHAIGHSLGARRDVAPGAALAMLVPEVLRFNLPARTERMADVAFALGVGDTRADPTLSAEAAIGAVTTLREEIGLSLRIGGLGLTEADVAQIAADTLDNEMLATTPHSPTQDDVRAILLAS
jgi:alcohol dehydrogenase